MDWTVPAAVAACPFGRLYGLSPWAGLAFPVAEGGDG